jgi:A/G-specific adenine glycosylase
MAWLCQAARGFSPKRSSIDRRRSGPWLPVRNNLPIKFSTDSLHPGLEEPEQAILFDGMTSAAPSNEGHRRQQATALSAKLLRWYDEHRRRLPWRAETGEVANPYHVLVSELMLQQTTVATVTGRFGPFLDRFPDLETLAAADEAEILHAWQGLGYYRRARALHAAAREVMARHQGRLPASVDALLDLPGIGDYTAKAVAAIAFGQPVLPVDGNGVRVFSRAFAIETPMPKAANEVRALAMAFEPAQRPADLAQAFMDLGAMVCRPKQPSCDRCPWREDCEGRLKGLAETLPKRAPKAKRPMRQGVAFLLSRADGAILFRKRPPEGLLGGLHELPTSDWLPAPIDRNAAVAAAPAQLAWRFHKQPVRHVFTHFTLELDLAEAVTDDPPDGLWQPVDALDELALPTLVKKLLKQAGRM